MNTDAERMIAVLSPEINKKCAQILEQKKERSTMMIFILLCIALIIVPTVFVFCGISLMMLLIPSVFCAAAVLILSPILIDRQGGQSHEYA